MKKIIFLNFLLAFMLTTAFAQGENNTETCCGKILDDSDLFRKNERVIFVNTEFLYWTAACKNNEYAFQYDRGIYNSDVYYGLGKYVFSKYNWDPGFRCALGYFNAPKTYQVIGQYTWVRIDNESSIKRKNPFDQPICATFPQYLLGMNQLDEARSKIRVKHDLGDFLASRVWITNLHLRLRLFGGLTGGKIAQKWDIAYTDVTSQVENVYNKWKFLGIGLRLGMDMDWFWTCHFYLTGKVSFAPYIGKYKYFGQISTQPDEGLHSCFKYNQYRGAYNVQAYFGPSYQRAFCKNRFEIFAGYELNGWFNVHEKIVNTSVLGTAYLNSEEMPLINEGMFLLHGLTTRLTLDF